jgi:hypothetical protein
MKQQFSATNIVVALVLMVGLIGFSAFRQKEGTTKNSFRKEHQQGDEDTTARGRRDRPVDDKNLDKLDEALKNLDVRMKELDERLKKMDFSKMEKETNVAMKKVDFEKMNKELEASMKKIDWQKMQEELNASMGKLKEVDMSRVKEQLARTQLQMEKHQHDMKLNHEHMQENIEKTMKHAHESMQKAQQSMEKAHAQLANLQEFTDALQADGLIDKKKDYNVEVKDGELYINGTKQSKEVSEKYKKYYKKDNFQINMNREKSIKI